MIFEKLGAIRSHLILLVGSEFEIVIYNSNVSRDFNTTTWEGKHVVCFGANRVLVEWTNL